MPSDSHNNLIESLRSAWESLDAGLMEPLLADDLHYYSWWALVEMNSKEEYLSYIRERFQAYKTRGTRIIVKLGVNKNDGEYAVAIQIEEDLPYLIRVKENGGKIQEMWIQPVE
ncbi:MAG: hypothetical protein IJ840_05625 [Bacteroidales bacterium]|nr:hypothetical protein [Bacteroidales bacterium]